MEDNSKSRDDQKSVAAFSVFILDTMVLFWSPKIKCTKYTTNNFLSIKLEHIIKNPYSDIPVNQTPFKIDNVLKKLQNKFCTGN